MRSRSLICASYHIKWSSCLTSHTSHYNIPKCIWKSYRLSEKRFWDTVQVNVKIMLSVIAENNGIVLVTVNQFSLVKSSITFCRGIPLLSNLNFYALPSTHRKTNRSSNQSTNHNQIKEVYITWWKNCLASSGGSLPLDTMKSNNSPPCTYSIITKMSLGVSMTSYLILVYE